MMKLSRKALSCRGYFAFEHVRVAGRHLGATVVASSPKQGKAPRDLQNECDAAQVSAALIEKASRAETATIGHRRQLGFVDRRIQGLSPGPDRRHGCDGRHSRSGQHVAAPRHTVF